MDKTAVGLVGTGIMGEPMARNLLRAGHAVCVHSRTKSKAERLLAEGARWADSPADLAEAVETVITVVADSPDVEAVYLGAGGVCEGLGEGTLCIDMSTVAPETAQRVSEAVRERKGRFLDAPVSGGKTGAESGALSIMVGGDQADVDRARAVFDVLGKSTVHCGPVGAGQLTKLCNQILCGLNLLGVCEAMVFGQRAGLNLETMLAAVSKGAAGSWALENLGSRMIRRDFDPMFMVALQNKDLRITLDAARGLDVPLPGTALVSQLLSANQAAGEGREGTQAMLKVLERLAGTNLESSLQE